MKKKYKTPVFISEIIKEEQYLLAASGGEQTEPQNININEGTPNGTEDAINISDFQL